MTEIIATVLWYFMLITLFIVTPISFILLWMQDH